MWLKNRIDINQREWFYRFHICYQIFLFPLQCMLLNSKASQCQIRFFFKAPDGAVALFYYSLSSFAAFSHFREDVCLPFRLHFVLMAQKKIKLNKGGVCRKKTMLSQRLLLFDGSASCFFHAHSADTGQQASFISWIVFVINSS